MKKTINESEKLNRQYMKELKEELQSAYRLELVDGGDCFIRILNRGEELFYFQAGKGLICEISAAHSLIYAQSIKKWDDGTKIGIKEKEAILNNILTCCERDYKMKDPRIVE